MNGLLSTGCGWLLGLVLIAGAVRGGEAVPPNKPLRLGVVLPLSGPFESHGKALLAGMRLREREVNAEKPNTVKLEVYDNGSETQRSADLVRELAADPGIMAILGPQNSREFAAMVGPAKEMAIPIIAPKATQDGLTADNPWAFRIVFNNGQQGTAMARFLIENLGLKRLAIFADLKEPYSSSLAQNFREAVAKTDAKLVYDGGFTERANKGATDYRPMLREIKDATPDAVFAPAYSDEVQSLVRQAGEVGLDAVFCGGDSWNLDTIFQGSGRRLHGSYVVAAFNDQENTPEVLRFLDLAARAGIEYPDSMAALSYDVVTVALLAYERATEKTRDGLRQALYSIKKYPLVSGETTITPDGEARKAIYIMKVVPADGGIKLEVVATILPKDE